VKKSRSKQRTGVKAESIRMSSINNAQIVAVVMIITIMGDCKMSQKKRKKKSKQFVKKAQQSQT
jgi:hypothetical protein